MTVLILSILLLFSISFLVRGRRGRLVGDAPHCARCRFDLSGIYPGAECCPECGAGVSNASAITIGKRVRDRRRTATGIVGISLFLSGVVLAYNGRLSRAGIVNVLPTTTLVTIGVDRPISWLDWETSYELRSRATGGVLTPSQQRRLCDALFTAIPSTDYEHIGRFGRLLSALGDQPGTLPQVREDIGAFLLERWAQVDEPWVLDWTRTLELLLDDGYISASDRDKLMADALTLRMYALPNKTLAPGEVFVVGLRIDERCPGSWLRDSTFHLILPPETKVGRRLHHTLASASDLTAWGVEMKEGALIQLIAPETPGRYVISSSLEYLPTAPLQSPGRGTKGLADVSGSVVIEVAGGKPPRSEPDPSAWLRSKMLPASWGYVTSPVGREFHLVVPIITAGAEFRASGSLVAVEENGTRVLLGYFDTSGESSRWTSSDRMSRFGGSRVVHAAVVGEMSGVSLQIPAEYAHPSSAAKLMLVFDQVSLGEDAGSMIEVELPWDRRLLRPLW